MVLSSFITYCLGALSNSNPAATILGQDAATPAAVAHLNHVLGLDKPLVVQYWDWLSQAVRGNLGHVLLHPDPGVPVDRAAAARRPVDRDHGRHPGGHHRRDGGDGRRRPPRRLVRPRPHDRLLGRLDAAGLRRRHHPGGHLRGGRAPAARQRLRRARRPGIGPWLEHIILPSLALALQVAADVARQLRTSLVAVLEQNYITGARVRGLPYRRILIRHALRNAAGPRWSSWATTSRIMLAGAVAAEVVFSLPGLGQLLLDAAQTRDIPVVQGVLLVVTTFVVVVNLVVNTLLDLLYRTNDGSGHVSGEACDRPTRLGGSVLRLPSARIALVILAAIVFLAIFGVGPGAAEPARPSTPTRCSRGRACTTCSAPTTSAGTCSAG